MEQGDTHQHVNVDIKQGQLTDDARVFTTRTGRPKISFRLLVRRNNNMPRKNGGSNCDFFTVVAYGDRFLPLLPLLQKGTLVAVSGYTQSRDIPDGRVVVETVAQQIAILRRMEDGE